MTRCRKGSVTIGHDLAHPDGPECIFGYLLEALNRRRQGAMKPFTLLSCDNLQGNGDVTRKVLLSFAKLRDPSLKDWL